MPSRKSLLKECIRNGLQELGRGRADNARTFFQQAVDLEPYHPKASTYLGTALLQLGDPERAVQYLERGTRALHGEPQAVATLAQAYFMLGRYEDAHASFQDASRLAPHEPAYLMGVANALAMQQRFDEGASVLETLLRRHPGHPLIWYNLGNMRREQHRPDDACRCYARALELEPQMLDARNNLGSVLHALYRFDEAEREYRACIAARPDYLPFQLNLVSLLIDTGQFAAAEAKCRHMLEAAPEAVIGRAFMGAALEHQGKLVQALEHKREAARLAPDDAQVAENYASGLARAGCFDVAWQEFDRALSLRPDQTSTRFARALALLSAGQWEKGWEDYRCRPASLRFAEKYPGLQRHDGLPSPLSGATIRALPEQGLGDELFFLRFARLVQAAGARVEYRPSSKLVPLLTRSGCCDVVVDEAVSAPLEAAMLVGDLPHALSLVRRAASAQASSSATGADFPDCPPPLPLRAADSLVAEMRERLRAIGSPPYLAVTWGAGTPPDEQGQTWNLYKTIDVARLGAALRDVSAVVLSVQRKPSPAEMQAFTTALGRPVHDFSELNDALERMLALLALLDEYVGVSNTNMHLSAGLGKAARVLVPCPAEWRWMASGDESPWFPGFRLYRQSLEGDWSAALDALSRDLRTRLGARPSS